MIRCSRCGIQTPRYVPGQRYCPPCERQVAELIHQDARRRAARFPAKDTTPWGAAL